MPGGQKKEEEADAGEEEDASKKTHPITVFKPAESLGFRSGTDNHYAWRTEQAYWCWIVRLFRHHRHPERSGSSGWQHPRTLGVADVAGFLSHLAIDRKVAAATQNQALNALVFLYAEVLHQPVGELGEWARSKRPKRQPVVLTRAGVHWMHHESFEPRIARVARIGMGEARFGDADKLTDSCLLQGAHKSPSFLSHPCSSALSVVQQPQIPVKAMRR